MGRVVGGLESRCRTAPPRGSGLWYASRAMPRAIAVLPLFAALLAGPAAQARPTPPPDHKPAVIPPAKRQEAAIAARVRTVLQAFRGKPDDASTWAQARAAVGNTLLELWRSGVLKGNKASLAYTVACGGGATMTQNDINLKRLVVVYGVALQKPAEFSYTVVSLVL